MKLYEILNDKYKDEINVKKIRMSVINKNGLSEEEQFDIGVLDKVIVMDEVFSGNGTSIDYRLWYTGKNPDSSYLNKDEWDRLKTIIQKEIPLVLKARIESLLCYINFKNCIDIVPDTVNDYLILLKTAVEKEEWHIAKVFAIMGISLSKKLGQGNDLFKNTVNYIKFLIRDIKLDEKSTLFVLSVIKKLAVLKMVDIDECEDIVKKSLIIGKNKPNDTLFDKILFVSKKIKLDIKEISQSIIDIYVENANKNDVPIQAVCMLEKAIKISREAGLNCEELIRMLTSKQKEIENHLHSFEMEIPLAVDKESIKSALEGNNIKQGIKLLMDFINPSDLDEFAEQDINFKVFNIGLRLIDDIGNTICNPSNEEYTRYHHFSCYTTMVSANIVVLLEVFEELYSINEKSLSFLFEDNEFIEKERVSLFTCAYNLAFHKRFYEAVYLLAPQAEYVFRRLAEMNGSVITNYYNDRTSEYYNLTTLFKNESIVESVDNNYLSAFKILLNEKCGANIRNLAAHGILNNNDICSMIYFCFLFLKFIISYKIV